MKVTRSEREGVAILRLAGEFDSFETEEMRRMFEECLREGRRRLVLDLTDLVFANSTTIAFFISAQKRAREAGGGMILARPGEFLRKTLKTLGLDQVLVISPDLDSAIHSLRG
ncbi:MAG: STAS domain-containing protein [Planctomycetes bacterium]|nr:STAS domain-containing protein [Planctomycetota bacterium]